MNSSESPGSNQGHEKNLARELLAYFQHAASTVGDAARLEEMLDELCSSDETLLTDVQVELRRRQAQDVKDLLKEKDCMMDALHEVYSKAMDEASAVGGGYYRDTAAKLTELEAEGYDALAHEQYQTFTQVLETIKTLGDRASDVLENMKGLGDRANQVLEKDQVLENMKALGDRATHLLGNMKDRGD